MMLPSMAVQDSNVKVVDRVSTEVLGIVGVSRERVYYMVMNWELGYHVIVTVLVNRNSG